MAQKIIIGIDTGNYCIKTTHCSFVSGVKKINNNMPFTQEILRFNGESYMLSQKRGVYLQDKTITEDYFILTLYGIGKELKQRGINTSNVIPISLGVGLPPSHIPLYKDKFRDYFKRGKISFEYDKQQYCIDIQNVVVFAQGYAGIYKDFENISKLGRAYIVDIGVRLSKNPNFACCKNRVLLHIYEIHKRNK